MGLKNGDTLAEKVKLKIPLSLGEGFEILRQRRQQNKETRAAHKRGKFPVHFTKPDQEMPDQMGQQQYLSYALSLIKREETLYYHILALRMQGLSINQLTTFLNSKGYNVTEGGVFKQEAAAIRYVQAKIEHLRKKGIPIFSDPAAKKPLIATA